MSTTTTNPTTRTLTGRVTSDKRIATRTVEVEWSRRHPQYGKVLKGQTVFHASDQNNESQVGDEVEIKQVRPISKTVTWQIVRVIKKGE